MKELLHLASASISSNKFLCPNHFNDNDFFNKFHHRLISGALPTKFPCDRLPLSDEDMMHYNGECCPIMMQKSTVCSIYFETVSFNFLIC